MDTIIITKDDIDFILKWRDEHPDLVRSGVCPLQEVAIGSSVNQTVVKAFRKGDKLKIYLSRNNISFGHMNFQLTPDGMWIKKKDTIAFGDFALNDEMAEGFKQTALTIYTSLMAYMVYGNDSERVVPQPKVVKAPSPIKTTKSSRSTPKKKPAGVTYIFNHTGKTPTLIVKGSRSSPGVEFSVRGHYRHYKSGKVVWIAQYTKGKGRRKDKRYRLGNPEDK